MALSVSYRQRRRQSGNVMVFLLGGVLLAGTLSYVISQMMSGPIVTISRVAKRITAETEMQSISRLVIVATENQASGSDCDSDGSIEPPEWRTTAGAKPTGGGLLSLTVGSSVTDPWGTDYGYCVWDVGATIKGAGCGGAGSNRLNGSPAPTDGKASTQTLFTIVSAGPDKTFQTTCSNYVDAATDQIVTSGDDKLVRYTHSDLLSQANSLWSIKPGTPSTAIINKDLEIGDSSAIGNISALSLETVGKVNAGGGAKPGDETVVTNCDGSAEGTLRYNDSTDNLEYCDGSDWLAVGLGVGSSSINELSDGAAQYTSLYSAFLGQHAGDALTTGVRNMGLGYNALKANDGSDNTGIGYNALAENDSGSFNTAIGAGALENNSFASGNNNTAVGYNALHANVLGAGNTAIGSSALADANGIGNVAIGYSAIGQLLVTGNGNVAVGTEALKTVSNVSFDVAIGTQTLWRTTDVSGNVAVGHMSQRNNTDSTGNTSVGHQALMGPTQVLGTVGQNNTAVGYQAMLYTSASSSENSAFGAFALQNSGDNNSVFGYQSMYAGGATNAPAASDNSAFGYQSLWSCETCSGNAAFGYQALYSATSGSVNVAFGPMSLATATAPIENTAIGYAAMYGGGGTSPSYNVAVGTMAMAHMTEAQLNVALGAFSLFLSSGASREGLVAVGSEAGYKFNDTASIITAVGYGALRETEIAGSNVAVGYKAGYNLGSDGTASGSGNTVVGYEALTNAVGAANNIVVGYSAMSAGTTGPRYNIAIGSSALGSADATDSNIAIGSNALKNLETSTGYNIAIGYNAAQNDTNAGGFGVALGAYALENNQGDYNMGIGYTALQNIDSGRNNVGIGFEALQSGGTGRYNTAIGSGALKAGGGVSNNTAIGLNALTAVSAGNDNTAVGAGVLQNLVLDSGNTAVGNAAMSSAAPRSSNTAFGAAALQATTGANGTALGYGAASAQGNPGQTTAVGYNALSANTAGTGNTAIGYGALPLDIGNYNTGIGRDASVPAARTNSTAVGYGAAALTSNYVRFGNTSVTTIAGQVAWTPTSDVRLKKDIRDTDLGLDFIRRLQPVSYRLKNGNGRLDYGFIAQDVEHALQGRVTNMVIRDADEMKTYKLRAADIIAPSVRAVQELSAVNDMEARVFSKGTVYRMIGGLCAAIAASFFAGMALGRILRRTTACGGAGC